MGLLLGVHRPEIEAGWFSFSWQGGQAKPPFTSVRETWKAIRNSSTLQRWAGLLGSWNLSSSVMGKGPTHLVRKMGLEGEGEPVLHLDMTREGCINLRGQIPCGWPQEWQSWGASLGDHKSKSFSQTKGDVEAMAPGQKISTKPVCLTPLGLQSCWLTFLWQDEVCCSRHTFCFSFCPCSLHILSINLILNQWYEERH